jgi:hypothetical protein
VQAIHRGDLDITNLVILFPYQFGSSHLQTPRQKRELRDFHSCTTKLRRLLPPDGKPNSSKTRIQSGF